MKQFISLYLITFFIVLSFRFTNSSKTYGLYKVSMKSFEKCSTPGREKYLNETIDLKIDKNGKQIVGGNLIIIQDIGPIKAKLQILKKNNNRNEQVLNIVEPDACKNIVMNTIIKNFANITKHCFIKKGNYTINVNLNKTHQDLIGTTFLYGTFYLKMEWYAAKLKIFCVSALVQYEST